MELIRVYENSVCVIHMLPALPFLPNGAWSVVAARGWTRQKPWFVMRQALAMCMQIPEVAEALRDFCAGDPGNAAAALAPYVFADRAAQRVDS